MFNNLNSTLKKVLVIFLIFTLTYANFVLVGSNMVNGLISYAIEEGEQNPIVANQQLVMNKVYEINGEEKRIIQVSIETGIESEENPIKETTITLATDVVEGTVEDVRVTELNKNAYTNGTWAIEDGKLKISLINENETLESKDKGLDKLLVTYVFPNSEVESIKQPLEKVEIKTYSSEDVLTNEVTVANFENIEVEKELQVLNVINKDIHKTTIESGKVDFTEQLNVDLSYRTNTSKIIVEDISNNFYNNDEQKNEEVTLKYKTTTINKEDLDTLLGEEGKLVITDTITNKIVAEITNAILSTQEIDVATEQKFIVDEEASEEEVRSNVTVTDETVVVEYVVDVTNLKIELENIKAQSESEIELSDFVIENTKSILNVNDLDNLKCLKENIKHTINETEITVESTINFKDTITRANLSVDNTEWVAGQANTVNYTITLDTTSEKSELFVNPMFLIELPVSVESINTANSQFTVNNDNGVFTNKKVFTTTVLGRKYIVITLTGAQTAESIQNGNTTVNLTLELNVSAEETDSNETTKLYYQNSTVTAYESGKSFDTAEIDIKVVMESEPKEEIVETVEPIVPEEGEETEGEFATSLSMVLECSRDDEDPIKPGEEFNYAVYVYNYGEEMQDLVITDVLPEGIEFIKVVEIVDSVESEDVNSNYDSATRTLTVNIDKIEGSVELVAEGEELEEGEASAKIGYKKFVIKVKANELPESVYSREIKNIVTLQKEDNVIAEKEAINIISDEFLIIETENISEQINENQEIILGLKITNIGLLKAMGVNVQISLPEEISPRMYKEGFLSETEESDMKQATLANTLEINISEIPAQTTYYIQLIGDIENIEETKSITVQGNVNGEEFSWTTEAVNVPEETPDAPETPSDTVNPGDATDPGKTEEPETPGGSEGADQPTNPDTPTEPENPDDPKNPIKPVEPEIPVEPDEPTNPGDSEQPENPNDPTNPENPDEPSNPENPEQPEAPENPEDPDGSEDPEKPGDEEKEYFDLSLNQYLNKVTVVNTQGTTTYDYTDTNFAKVEIHAKHMNGSKITLEYKMVIKNEGAIPGYARKIVNYIPEGLTFNPDINKDWFLGDDGNAYSVKFIDRLLNPGETVELSIVLEKQMTNENTGAVINLAEIYEASNDEKLEDINSIPGDKLEGQNDMSKVEVIVAVRTGTVIIYITLAIVVIAILALGFYKVKKVTLNKKGGC